jgi:hypothetical protein
MMKHMGNSLNDLLTRAAQKLWPKNCQRRLGLLDLRITVHRDERLLDNPVILVLAPEGSEDPRLRRAYHWSPELTLREWNEEVGKPIPSATGPHCWDVYSTPCPPGHGGWYEVLWRRWYGPYSDDQVVEQLTALLARAWEYRELERDLDLTVAARYLKREAKDKEQS